MRLVGGIDLGGTKIEARLFDPARGWALTASRERPTPRADYAALVAALAEQVGWLTGEGAGTVGLGAPGLVSADGVMLTSNLPASGRPLPADLEAATGRPVRFVNDCRAFTLSEARLGAGRGARSVLGLVVGTGLAGGIVHDGRLLDGPNGQAGEFGHMPMPHGAVAAHGLPWIACGCGRTGCFETVCSGPGIARIADLVLGAPLSAQALAAEGGARAERVFEVWADVTAELLLALVLVYDPETVVLGGGVSKLANVADRLTRALTPKLLAGVRPPTFCLAEGGDRSGARGAALLAMDGEATA